MIKKFILNWLNRFYDKSEEDYRMANIANVVEEDDIELMKEFRLIMKALNGNKNAINELKVNYDRNIKYK